MSVCYGFLPDINSEKCCIRKSCPMYNTCEHSELVSNLELSNLILSQKEEFDEVDISKISKYDIHKIKRKIQQLFEAKVLTYTGYKYYVN